MAPRVFVVYVPQAKALGTFVFSGTFLFSGVDRETNLARIVRTTTAVASCASKPALADLPSIDTASCPVFVEPPYADLHVRWCEGRDG